MVATEHVRELLRSAPLVDGHNDLAWAHRELAGYDLDAVDIAEPQPRLHTDLPRLRRGGVGAQFWSVYAPGSLTGEAAVTTTLEQIAFVYALAGRYPDDLRLSRTSAEVDSAVRAGCIASLLGMEGGHCINQSLGVLAMMAELGVRYLTLTHNQNVPWADSATDEPVLHGLSGFGERVVERMNQLGMVVDLSHVSADVMRHALDVTSAPVMFSHSSARAVCDVPRNVPDDVLARLRDNGGVCMVTFVPGFVSPATAWWYAESQQLARARGLDPRDLSRLEPLMAERAITDPPPVATLNDVVRHIDHVRDVAGVDAVGIGGDYDGTGSVPEDLTDVAAYPALFQALAERGWSDGDLRKLAGRNALRVLREAEDARS